MSLHVEPSDKHSAFASVVNVIIGRYIVTSVYCVYCACIELKKVAGCIRLHHDISNCCIVNTLT